MRAGSIVFVGIAAANLGNYLFHFISARLLGPAPYGDLASLLALAGLIGLPLGGVQFALARYVAHFGARGEDDAIGALYRRSVFLGLGLGALMTFLLLALAVPLQHTLGIKSLSAVLLTALVTAPAVLTPVAMGLAQGLQRFRLFSVALIAGAPVRVLLALLLLTSGLGVAGAMSATLTATVVAVLIPVIALGGWHRRGRGLPSPVQAHEAASYVFPVTLGLLAITSLTTVDVIVAKAAFPEHLAGVYGGASLIGRVILYLPTAIVTVLLPKVSARSAENRETADILEKSLLATGSFCVVATLIYILAPGLIVRIALGTKFEDASGLLWMFALAMTGYALLNVLLAYNIGRGRSSFSWLLVGGALTQLAGFGVFHGSPRQLLAVSISVAFSLLFITGLFAGRRFARGVLGWTRRR